ncbi:MAG TPA: c-type cytochrome [Vicinamibacterales bacterium]|nr:c-type cytochrome [Vicinamibacterales bacterium]
MKHSLILVVCAAVLGVMPLTAEQKPLQERGSKPVIKREPAQRLRSVEGANVYKEYCAVCHGVSGRGDGPAAAALKTPPADLTTIAERYGRFPRATIRETILAENDPPIAHGTREMPVWGPILRRSGGRDVAVLAAANLLQHLESIQRK